jgi:hypothetical protein
VPLRSELRVAVFDRRGHFGLDSRPLGAALLPAAAVPGTDGPVFLWLPLAPPGDDKEGIPLSEVGWRLAPENCLAAGPYGLHIRTTRALDLSKPPHLGAHLLPRLPSPHPTAPAGAA